jgi:hypothetical protein
MVPSANTREHLIEQQNVRLALFLDWQRDRGYRRNSGAGLTQNNHGVLGAWRAVQSSVSRRFRIVCSEHEPGHLNDETALVTVLGFNHGALVTEADLPGDSQGAIHRLIFDGASSDASSMNQIHTWSFSRLSIST